MKTNDDDDGFTLNLCESLMLHFKLFGLNLAPLFLPVFFFNFIQQQPVIEIK